MQVIEVIVTAMKSDFRPYLPTSECKRMVCFKRNFIRVGLFCIVVLPSLRERLSDAKDQVREQAQHFIQVIMTECVSSPQAFLDRLLEPCLVHKNWRVKEQGLLCLSRTLS